MSTSTYTAHFVHNKLKMMLEVEVTFSDEMIPSYNRKTYAEQIAYGNLRGVGLDPLNWSLNDLSLSRG